MAETLERFSITTSDGLFTVTIQLNRPANLELPMTAASVAELAQLLYDTAMKLTNGIAGDGQRKQAD
jgi:hypothetical protein